MHSSVALAYLVVYVGWGTTYLAGKYVAESFPIPANIAIRLVIAAAILLAAARFFSRDAWRVTREELSGAFLVGVPAFGISIMMNAYALRLVPSGVACVALGSTSFVLAIVEHFFLGRRMRPWEIAGGIVSFLGVLLLTLARASTAAPPLNVPGLFLLSGGVLFWCIATVFAKRLPQPRDNRTSTALQALSGALSAAVFGVFIGSFDLAAMQAACTPRFLVSFVYLTVFGSAVILPTYNWLIRREPLVRVNTYLFVNPVIAVFVGWLVAGEPFDGVIGGALVITLLGTALTLFGGRLNLWRFSGYSAQSGSAGKLSGK